MFKHFFFSTLLHGFWGLFLILYCIAEEENAVQLETAVLKAEKRNLTEEKWDQSFYQSYNSDYIEAEELIDQSFTDVKSALKDLPGIQVKEQGAFVKQLEIRGFSGEKVATFLDGFKVSNQGMTHAGGGESNLVDLNSVARIDVIKGSPSVLFDPGATGGSVLIKTKEPIGEPHMKGGATVQIDEGYEKKR